MSNPIAQAVAFVAALFPDPTSIVERRALQPFAQTWHTDRAELARKCLASSEAGANVYIGVNRRKAVGMGTADGVLDAGAFVADFDAQHITATEPAGMVAEVRARIDRAMMPPPSMIVWSGRGVHVYWLLAVPLADLDLWETIQDAIITTLGSDPAIKDRARIMRVPGTVNQKPGAGPCYLIEIDADRRYEVDDIGCAVWHGNSPEPCEPDVEAVDAAIGSKPERSGIGAGGHIIDEFIARTPIRSYYASEAYDIVGHRFRRPGKRGRGFNGIFRTDRRGREVACHFSTIDQLNDKKFGGKFGVMGIHDVFSAFCLLRHKGDTNAAVKDAARRLGIGLPKQKRDGDVLRAIAASADAAEFEALWFGEDAAGKTINFIDLDGLDVRAAVPDARLFAILAKHTTNPKQIARLLDAARRRKEAA